MIPVDGVSALVSGRLVSRPVVTLTEAERDALHRTMRRWRGTDEGLRREVLNAVERILAARTPTATGDAECPSNTKCRGTCRKHTPMRPEHYATATGDDLRDRVTALADEWDGDSDGVMTCGWAADRLSEALCESFAVSPAPVVSRPEAATFSEFSAIYARADYAMKTVLREVDRFDRCAGDLCGSVAIGCAETGPCCDDCNHPPIRAVSLAPDPEAP